MGADEGVPCEKSFVGLVAGVTGDPHLAGALKVRRYLSILQHARWGEDADGPGSADIPATSNPSKPIKSISSIAEYISPLSPIYNGASNHGGWNCFWHPGRPTWSTIEPLDGLLGCSEWL